MAPAPRPAQPPAAAPRPAAPSPAAAAPAAPTGRRDPFGFGVGAPAKAPAAPAPPAPEEDFGDIDVEPPAAARGPAPSAPALDDLSVDIDTEAAEAASPPAPIELPAGPESEPELAPMHAFVPPPDQVGHKPEPVPAAAARDGGEALLREALSKASLEVIEKIVWEVVPQLAETIIRENLDRLVKQRQG